MAIDKYYHIEKVEAYNVAIEALRAHESADQENQELGIKLRNKLANKLDREIDRWCRNYNKD